MSLGTSVFSGSKGDRNVPSMRLSKIPTALNLNRKHQTELVIYFHILKDNWFWQKSPLKKPRNSELSSMQWAPQCPDLGPKIISKEKEPKALEQMAVSRSEAENK